MPGLNGISDRLPSSRLDLEQVAGAVILDRDDCADAHSRRGRRRQADQIGVIIFALLERRQRGAVDLDQRAAQRLGGGAVVDALEAGHGASCRCRGRKEPRSAPRRTGFLARQALDAVAEQLQPNLALDAMRAGDRGEGNPALAAIVSSMLRPSRLPRRRLQPAPRLDSPSAAPRRPDGDSAVGGATRRRLRPARPPTSPSVVGFAAAAGCFLGGRRFLRRGFLGGGFLGQPALLRRRSLLGGFLGDGFGLGGRLGSRLLDRFGDHGLGLFLLRRRLRSLGGLGLLGLARSSTRSLAFSPGSRLLRVVARRALA